MAGDFSIGRAINEGYAIFKPNMSSMIGVGLVYLAIQVALNIIPFAGIITLFINGPLYAGLFIVALDAASGNSPKVGRMFDGFSDFLKYFLLYIVTALIIAVPAVIMIIVMAVTMSLSGIALDGTEPEIGQMIPLLLIMVIGLVVVIFVAAWYVFAYLFAINQNMDFWPAMEASRKLVFTVPGGIIGLMFMEGLIMILGILAFGVGIFLAFPLTICITVAAYQQLAGSAPALSEGGSSSRTAGIFAGGSRGLGLDAGGAAMNRTRPVPPPLGVDAKTLRNPYASGQRRLMYVMVEGVNPSPTLATKIAGLAAPESATQNPLPVVVGFEIKQWPDTKSALQSTLKQRLTDYARSNSDAADITDTSTYKLALWVGKDKKSGKNMAVASIIAL
jgi:hypothetical protein